MTGRPNPILYYHPDAYRVERHDLKGRHSAGESFLTALLDHSTDDVFGLCTGKQAAEDFVRTVQASHPQLTPKALSRADHVALSRQGLLHLPFPLLGGEACLRSHLGDDAYAICGVTHTISSREVLDSVNDLPAAPVQPWDALICTSQSVHGALTGVLTRAEERLRERLGASRFVRPMMPIIPLGVHSERFAPKAGDRAHWRKKLGLDDDAIAILFFGRLSIHAKASPFPLALATEQAAKRSGRRFELVWCGWFNDDFQRQSFMETAQSMAPSVRFHHIDGREVATRFSIWAAADIFCSLSDNIQESFGLTVIEAMAAELPIVVSNWNGYREAVDHGKNGVLVDSYMPRSPLAAAGYRYVTGIDTYDLYIGALSQLCFVDIEQTANWLARLASEPELRRSLAAAARRTVAERFDWKAVMPRYAELWGEQLARLAHARNDSSRTSSRSWKALDPSSTFAGFPSHNLKEDVALAAGPQFARWSDLVKQPGIVINASVLTGRAQFQALHKLYGDGKPHTPADAFARFSAPERDAIDRTLHWAIKIGLLRISK